LGSTSEYGKKKLTLDMASKGAGAHGGRAFSV